MNERSRDEKGRFDSNVAYSDVDFRQAVAELELPTTGDIAREVGCKRATAHRRLTQLEESGDLESRSVGNALVWSVR
ncbi:helix-turn-helix domain-containing protein [Natronosalvus halobius]|uniref:helix-turn-helix domain-containing protein n=1 Tax=Natronosalvus halobius TaxID=2953746 RepID=UPI0031B9C2F3